MLTSLNTFLKNTFCDHFLLFRSLARDNTLSGIHQSQSNITSAAQAATNTRQQQFQKVFDLRFTSQVTQVDSWSVFLKATLFPA